MDKRMYSIIYNLTGVAQFLVMALHTFDPDG